MAGGFATEVMGEARGGLLPQMVANATVAVASDSAMSAPLTQTDSQRRRVPSQERSRDTVEAILAAAGALIEEGGISALTTNAVARRAGVAITAVYGYFDDKWAIVHELFRRFEQVRGEALAGIFETWEADADWADAIDETWERMAEFRIQFPGGIALRAAMASEPRLAELDFEGSQHSAQLFAAAMCRRVPGLDREDAFRAAWSISLVAGTLIDDAVRDGEIAWDRIYEGTTILKTHLARYLGEPLSGTGRPSPDAIDARRRRREALSARQDHPFRPYASDAGPPDDADESDAIAPDERQA